MSIHGDLRWCPELSKSPVPVRNNPGNYDFRSREFGVSQVSNFLNSEASNLWRLAGSQCSKDLPEGLFPGNHEQKTTPEILVLKPGPLALWRGNSTFHVR